VGSQGERKKKSSLRPGGGRRRSVGEGGGTVSHSLERVILAAAFQGKGGEKSGPVGMPHRRWGSKRILPAPRGRKRKEAFHYWGELFLRKGGGTGTTKRSPCEHRPRKKASLLGSTSWRATKAGHFLEETKGRETSMYFGQTNSSTTESEKIFDVVRSVGKRRERSFLSSW